MIRSGDKGFSLLEILVGVAILMIVAAAIFVSYANSLKVFTDAKSISDNIETKTPTIELIARYFDRWGVGVVSRESGKGLPGCTGNCPATQKLLAIASTNGCSDVTFYGNIQGMGFVTQVASGTGPATAQLISCRLNTDASNNCYVLWRSNSPMNPTTTGGTNVIPLALQDLTLGNQDCSQLPSSTATISNATMNKTMSPWSGAATQTAQPGDVVQRAAHEIRLYCDANPDDGDRRWLYVDLTDHYGSCSRTETGVAVAPVQSFTATAIAASPLPAGTTCDTAMGGTGCAAVEVSVVFRSQSKTHSGQYDTFLATRVFGR